MMSRALLVLMLAIGVSAPADAAPKKPRPAAAKRLPKKRPVTPSPASIPAPPAKPTLSDQDAAIVMRFFNMFVDVIAAAKEDCTAIAANVNMLMDQNKELLRLMKKANLDKFEFPKPMMDKVMARFQTIMPALTKCMNDPDVEAAFKRFDDKQPEQPQIN